MTRLKEIRAYWTENYGAAITNGDVDWLIAEVDRLSARVAELEGALQILRKAARDYIDETNDNIAGLRSNVPGPPFAPRWKARGMLLQALAVKGGEE